MNTTFSRVPMGFVNDLGDSFGRLDSNFLFRVHSFPIYFASTCLLLLILLLSRTSFHGQGIPGPFITKISPFWLATQCRLLRRSQQIHKLHQSYGSVVQIGPNHVSVVTDECLQIVYGPKSGTTKGPFYDVFRQTTPIIFSSRDDGFHARRRKELTPAFTKAALRRFEPHMSQQILKFRRALTDVITKGNGAVYLDFKHWANYLAFDIIAEFVFGHSFGFVDAGYDFHGLITTIDDRMQTINVLGVLPPWARVLAKWVPFQGDFWRRSSQCSLNLQDLAREAIRNRNSTQRGGQDANVKEVRQDMMAFLLQAKEDDGTPLSEVSIISEAASFISGGSDSASTTLTHFVDLVSSRPQVKVRLQQELDEAFPSDIASEDNWIPDEAVVNSLPYLNALLKETLRLRPTSSSGLERIVVGESMTIVDKASDKTYILPRGICISVPTYTLHHRPDVFPSPDEFLPERWLGTNNNAAATTTTTARVMGKDGKLTSWAPFSYGVRGCLGKGFAWMELTKSAAMLFRVFDVIRASDGETVLEEGFFLKAKECKVVLMKR